MGKGEIGFGVPVNLDKTWESEVGGLTYTFTKIRDKGGFLYGCKCGRGWGAPERSFHSDRDITPTEVEQLRQFADFIASFQVP